MKRGYVIPNNTKEVKTQCIKKAIDQLYKNLSIEDKEKYLDAVVLGNGGDLVDNSTDQFNKIFWTSSLIDYVNEPNVHTAATTNKWKKGDITTIAFAPATSYSVSIKIYNFNTEFCYFVGLASSMNQVSSNEEVSTTTTISNPTLTSVVSNLYYTIYVRVFLNTSGYFNIYSQNAGSTTVNLLTSIPINVVPSALFESITIVFSQVISGTLWFKLRYMDQEILGWTSIQISTDLVGLLSFEQTGLTGAIQTQYKIVMSEDY